MSNGNGYGYRPPNTGSIAWVYRNILRYSGNPSKLLRLRRLSRRPSHGHGFGSRLGQRRLAAKFIKGATATSGVYDFDMVMQISVNEQVRMTPEIARENSPSLHPPLSTCPVIVAVGGANPKAGSKCRRIILSSAKNTAWIANISSFRGRITTPCRSISPMRTAR